MPSHDSYPTADSRPARKSSIWRYVIPLLVLVIVISGIAWVTQYLPRWKLKPVGPGNQDNVKKLLEFPRPIAKWYNPPPEDAKKTVDGIEKVDDKEKIVVKDYEPGSKGHYDFPFKNQSGADVEITFFSSSCDCASVQAAVLSSEELARAFEASEKKPADALPYSAEPDWRDLKKEPEWSKLSKEAKAESQILVKPDQGGVVRVRWVAKAAGQEMTVMPIVWHQRLGDVRPTGQRLGVPAAVASPVRFYPPRINVGGLTLGARASEEFIAWSSTRDTLDLQLSAAPANALFDIKLTPLNREECTALETTLRNDKAVVAGKAPPQVLSAHRVVVTVHESKDGKQLDLGTFFRKLDVSLDNIPARDVPGPEIVGRVHGGIVIGGADDQGRIRFKTFSARESASRTVELSADAKWELEAFKQDPAWIKVTLTRAAKQDDPQRTIWRLNVEVPPDTPAAHSFEEPNAVILRIVGPPERFVRIPLEGHLTNH